MVVFSCSKCNASLSAEEPQRGQLVRCPQCLGAVRVPDQTTTTPSQFIARPGAGTVGSSRRYGFNCVYCSSRLEATEAMAAQEGQCPTCGKTIYIPILDRSGRLIDPITKNVIKQDPHPVHAYAAAGDRAPHIIRHDDGSQSIRCPKCNTISSITTNNCRHCGTPFTMEGTTPDAGGASNGFAVASLVLGILGLPFFCTMIVPALGVIFGIIALVQMNNVNNSKSGKGLAIAGVICGGLGMLFFVIMIANK